MEWRKLTCETCKYIDGIIKQEYQRKREKRKEVVTWNFFRRENRKGGRLSLARVLRSFQVDAYIYSFFSISHTLLKNKNTNSVIYPRSLRYRRCYKVRPCKIIVNLK